MPASSDDSDFWDRVEHEFKVSNAGTWLMTIWLLRLGIATVMFSALYMLMQYLLTPATGYFFSRLENAVHPVFWGLVGTIFIICGAFLRFRAIGPIVDKFKAHGYR